MTPHADQFEWDDTSEVRERPSSPELDGGTLHALEQLARCKSGRQARGQGVALRAKLGEAGAPIAGLIDALVERAGELERALRQAGHDELTGIANRRSFDAALRRELSRARRSARPLSLLLFDLDGLKIINDSLGHAAGDRALREVAARASDVVRSGDLVARLGGDEFAVLLPDTEMIEAATIGERIRDELAALRIGISVGVATQPGAPGAEHVGSGGRDPSHGSPAERLLAHADRALYRDKTARNSMRPSAI